MGLILDARCEGCGFERAGLKVGATTAQMSGERRSARHLFACPSCGDLASVELFLGEPRASGPCERCAQPLEPRRELERRVVTMSGEKLLGHECPRCGEKKLAFKSVGTFL